MNESRYYVWSPSKGAPSVAHSSADMAIAEAKRLAQVPDNKGCAFFVLRAVCSIEVPETPFVQRNFCKG